jgi:hypothetical protein
MCRYLEIWEFTMGFEKGRGICLKVNVDLFLNMEI